MNKNIPIIRQINQLACKVPGKESISLGLGQLGNGFELAPEILEVLEKISKDLKNGINTSIMYSPNAGLLELRKEVSKEQGNKDGNNYSEDNVIITIGVQNAIQATIGVLNNLGYKRVLIPEIFFGIYKKIPLFYNMEVETYKLNENFGLDLEYLSKKIKKDDIIIFNSPANPTGKVFSENEVKQICKILQNRLSKGYIISDEIYDKLVYEKGKKTTSFAKYFERTITVNGISKSGAMAGNRIGWIVSKNIDLIEKIFLFNTNQISSPPTISQMMALPVVEGKTAETIEEYKKKLIQNRDLAIKLFDKYSIPYVKPEGGFYIFPKISSFINESVFDFCKKLAQKENGVVVIPGIAFGKKDYVRISLAIQSKKFKQGIERFVNFLKN